MTDPDRELGTGEPRAFHIPDDSPSQEKVDAISDHFNAYVIDGAHGYTVYPVREEPYPIEQWDHDERYPEYGEW